MLVTQPIGTLAERQSGRVWPGNWFDATGYKTVYSTGAVGSSYHTGADLNLNTPVWNSDKHAPVYAVADGVVTHYVTRKTWGQIIVIKHDPDENGQVWYSRYAHVTGVTVKSGDRVTCGKQICEVGDADGQQPWHLHFDISPTIVLANNPGHWPGLDRISVLINYVDPKVWLASRIKPVDVDQEIPWFGRVNVDVLNIRTQPSTSSIIKATLKRGIRVPVAAVKDQPNWLMLKSPYAESYVWKEYITKETDGQVPEVPQLITVYIYAKPTLRVRSQPNTSSDIITNLADGAKVQVWVENAEWYFVPEYSGYISRLYTSTVPPLSWTSPFDAHQRGLHLSAGGWNLTRELINKIRSNGIVYGLTATYELGAAQGIVNHVKSGLLQHLVVRMATHEKISNPRNFFNACKPALDIYASALRQLIVAVHNEPNLYKEGFGSAWQSAEEFNDWLLEVYGLLRTQYPGIILGFPALSPGGAVNNIRIDEIKFANACADAIRASHWVGVHAYWPTLNAEDFDFPISRWKAYAGSKPLIATEVGPIDGLLTTPTAIRKSYALGIIHNVPVFSWVGDGAGAWSQADWLIRNIQL